MSYRFTQHAEQRLSQRGFRKTDLDVIRECGTLIDDKTAEVYVVTNKGADEAIHNLKQRISAIERLRNCKLVVNQDDVITIMRAGREHTKKMLRRAV